MRKTMALTVLLCLTFCTTGCSPDQDEIAYTADTKIADVQPDPAFGTYGRLIFPVDEGYYSGTTLGELRLTWYNGIDPDKTVEIANYMKDHAEVGETIFYDIYTAEEKAADPAKEDTALFFFKGDPGARFAVCNAGGGFALGIETVAEGWITDAVAFWEKQTEE